jgi:uncharacterized protein YjhX (UPF0386 family)
MRACLLAYKFYESTPRLMQFARVLVDQGYIVDVVCLRRDGQSHFEVVDDVNLFRIQVRIRNESNRLDYIYRIICRGFPQNHGSTGDP